jgi:hypothetical protein
LRELHYCDTSQAPKAFNPTLQAEDDYWQGCARNSPGLSEMDLQAELTRRKTESSTPAA